MEKRMFCETLAKKACFASAIEEDIAKAMEANMPATSKAVTNFWLSTFHHFCSKKAIAIINLKTCMPQEVDGTWCKFYDGL